MVPPEPVTHCTASAGTPASTRISVSLRADSGVSDAGLMMTALPAASAGPTLWATRLRGKLNGLIAATTPHGTRRVNPSWPVQVGAPSSGTTSPDRRFASSAEPVMVWMARSASPRPSPMILPSSMVMVRPRSSTRSLMRPTARVRISYRW